MSDEQRTPPKKAARRRKRPASAQANAAPPEPTSKGPSPAPADAPAPKRTRKPAAARRSDARAGDAHAGANRATETTTDAAPTAPDALRAAPAGTPAASGTAIAPTPAPLLLRTRLDVRWGDMDAFNHVNNARFLSYLQEARLRWLQGLAGPWLDDDTAPVLAASNVNFRRPIEWPCTLAIELHAERSGRSSLTLGHRIVDAADPTVLYSDGSVVMVWIDRRSGKPSTLPSAVREACGG
jgi:acyl-CoA thioester hydrolase